MLTSSVIVDIVIFAVVALSLLIGAKRGLFRSLAELGDREDGRFTLRYTLKNLSDQAADYALTVRVLTDAYTEDGGTACSLMSPLDITEGVSVAGPASVSVPAGGEAEIVFELAIRDGLRRELAEAYPNGFYVEGYVTAAGAESGPAVHGTFLGFCGDWEAAPVLEAADFRDLQEESFRLAGEGHGPAEYNPLQVPEPCLEGLGADAIGLNCSLGPDKLAPFLAELCACTRLPVIAKPNAGLPVMDEAGRARYGMGPEDFARHMLALRAAGASLLGGCCGSTPAYIRRLAALL